MKKIISALVILALVFPILASGKTASAATVKTLSGVSNLGDFAVSAGKFEVFLDAGKSKTEELTVTNRLGKESKFKVEVEDFGPSDDPMEVTKLYGDDAGPYSLKEYMTPELNTFTLKAGEQITFNVDIDIPKDAPAGGLYGTVLVSNVPDMGGGNQDELQGQLGITSRLGVLFFVTVRGNIVQNGSLVDFTTDKNVYFKDGKISFEYSFKNDGNIYLKPSGMIAIRNSIGQIVSTSEVMPFFVLPKTTRTVNSEWSKGFMLGKYTATLELDTGVPGKTETMSTTFWVLPAPVLIIVILTLIALIAVIMVERNVKREKVSLRKSNKKKKK